MTQRGISEKHRRRGGATARRRQGQRGNALAEFALMSTVLLMLSLGVVDLGRIFTAGDQAFNAATSGTQYGALSPAHYSDTAGMVSAARANLTHHPDATVTAEKRCYCQIGGTPVTCPATCASGSPETYIEVKVQIPFNTISSLPWLPQSTTVNGKSVVRVE